MFDLRIEKYAALGLYKIYKIFSRPLVDVFIYYMTFFLMSHILYLYDISTMFDFRVKNKIIEYIRPLEHFQDFLKMCSSSTGLQHFCNIGFYIRHLQDV